LSEFVETREIIERIKDIMSNERDGFIYDKDVAIELQIPNSTLRFAIYKNRIPYMEISKFCYKRKLIINDIIF